MSFWILLTLGGALLQNARSALQKDLKTAIGPEGGGVGATFARFGYALPFAALFFAVAAAVEPGGLRLEASSEWVIWTLIVAGSQIGATWALLRSFDYANFAVGTAFSKCEALLAAVFGAALLGDWPSGLAALGVFVSLFGAFTLSLPARREASAADDDGRALRAAFWGLAAAALFGLAAVAVRGASLSLESGSVLYRAAATLLLTLLLQSLLMGLWMRWARPRALTATIRAWRPGLSIGAAGAGASACWFAAMTLEPAAHVRTLGQVELVFAVLTAWLFFRDPPSRQELIGVALIGLGAALLLSGTA